MDLTYRLFRSVIARVAIFALCLYASSSAIALEIDIERPEEREFVRDLADMLDPQAEEQIRETCDKLLTDTATPIIVVTINSMRNHCPEPMRIETFAALLFNQWQIGHEKINGQNWNTGILLLVSKNDRKARIELGAGWGRHEDQLCSEIMAEQIIANFKQGRFSDGIVAGVGALDMMARKLEIPRPPRPWWHYALIIGAVILAIFTVVSMVRNGSSGWAWLFWGVVFAAIGTLLYTLATNSGNGGGGGFGGGSYGGGYSGGGGATGSW